MPNANPYYKLDSETLQKKKAAGHAWLKANKSHPKFSTFLQQYFLIESAIKYHENIAEKKWCAEMVEVLMHIFPGATVEN